MRAPAGKSAAACKTALAAVVGIINSWPILGNSLEQPESRVVVGASGSLAAATASDFALPIPADLPLGTRAVSLAEVDLDADRSAELAVAYAFDDTGYLVVHRGAPRPPPTLPRLAAAHSRFGDTSAPIALPLVPEFLLAGDFDDDGNEDLIAGSPGAAGLWLLAGDGMGGFNAPEWRGLPGELTAAVAGEVNRRDGRSDLVVAVSGDRGNEILLLEGREGAWAAKAERIAVRAPVTDLALGRFDGHFAIDIAALAGGELLLVHGRDRRLAAREETQAKVAPPRLQSVALPHGVVALAAHDWVRQDRPRDELAVLSADGSLRLLHGAGEGQAPSLIVTLGRLPTVTSASQLVPAWLGQPGQPALLALDPSSPEVHVFFPDAGAPEIAETGRAASPGREALALLSSPAAVQPIRANGRAPPALAVLAATVDAPVVISPENDPSDLVNVAVDGVDGDVADCQCDTGSAMSGFTKMCTLRAAIQTHNHEACGAPGIGFAGPFQGMGAIKPSTQLPTITQPVSIDGLGRQVEIDGSECLGCTRALEVDGTATITDLVVYNFSNQLVLTNGNGSMVSGSILGTTPDLALPGSSARGVWFINCGNCTADNNIVAGIIEFAGAGSHSGLVLDNHVGVGPMGEDLEFGQVLFFTDAGGNHTVRGNFVASNGLQIRLFGDNTGSSLIEDNFAGITPTGAALGGTDTGIEVRGDMNTVSDNLVSGNGSDGIAVVGGGAQGANNNVVDGNLVGTNPAGGPGAGNGGRGINIAGNGGMNIVRENVIALSGAEGIRDSSLGGLNEFLFNLVGTDSSGTAALGNALDGIRISSPEATIDNNLVSGNGGQGIRAEGAGGSYSIVGNVVGTDLSGTVAFGNFNSGIFVSAPNVNIQDNLVAANSGALGGAHGIVVQTANATGVTVRDNRIGIADNFAPLGNSGHGIYFTISAHDNIAEHNVIANNGLDGIDVGSGTGNELTENAIFGNGDLGIDLGNDGPTPNDASDTDPGPNDFQNYPVLTGIMGQQLQGTLNSTANRSFRIEIYSNEECDPSGFGEGASFVAKDDSVSTDNIGNANFAVAVPATLANPTATATDLVTGDTSEFSQCLTHDPPKIIINSVGVDPDAIPDDPICDTGEIILRDGVPEPECTLVAGIQTGHVPNGAKLLVFDIPPTEFPGDPVPIIRLGPFLLPSIAEPLKIDGSTQPAGGTVAVSGSDTAPLPVAVRGVEGPVCGNQSSVVYQLVGSDARITGQTLYCVVDAVLISGTDNAVLQNVIANSGNGVRVTGAAANGNEVADNLLILNGTGIRLDGDSIGSFVADNRIGTDGNGADLGNDYGIYIKNSSHNVIDDNIVARSQNAGITLDGSGGDGTGTTGNLLRGNHIGTDTFGRLDLGNRTFGVRILGARDNFLGSGADSERNVISGNGTFSPPGMETGGGILVEGGNATGNEILGNYIGTSPDGYAALGNAAFGIRFDGADTNTVGDFDAGNVISGNVGDGIQIFGNGMAAPVRGIVPPFDPTQGQLIQNNAIGIDTAGLSEVGNGGNGITVLDSASNLIFDNLISGNDAHGVQVIRFDISPLRRNLIIENVIGIGLDGFDVPNQGHGVYLLAGETTVAGNSIHFSGGSGVRVEQPAGGAPAVANVFVENEIHLNDGLGIDLAGGDENGFGVTANDSGDGDPGANNLVNFPVLTGVIVTPSTGGAITTVRGTYDHSNVLTSDDPFIEVFSSSSCDPSGFGEGAAFEVSSFKASSPFQFAFKPSFNSLTATSSVSEDSARSTSEFSNCIEAPPLPPSYLVINEIDAQPAGDEFIELSSGGSGGMSLTGKVLVIYDGADDLSYAAFDLDGYSTDADGFFVAGNATVPEVGVVFADGLLLDGPAAAALYDGDAVDFPNGTPVTTDNLIDAVVYGPAEAPDAGLLVLLEPDQPQVDEAAAGDAPGHSQQRCPDSSGGERFTDTYHATVPNPGKANTCAICFFDTPQTEASGGEDVSLTVTVLVDAYIPTNAIDVDFEVVTGPNDGETGADTTDANGEAEFSYTGLGGGGDDEVTASGDFGGVPFSCSANVNWISELIFAHGFE